jgi:RHH-type proline utilization regulon transcriptional repressor/proline dehydrogenase/delta 1-pyrroline-5-carboxylate dehydrogenase
MRVPARLRQLIEWLRQNRSALISADDSSELIQTLERYAQTTLIGAHIALKGYVGESDELRLHSRGVLRSTARSMYALISQLGAALATGNTLDVDDSELCDRLVAALPATLGSALSKSAPSYQVVLVDAAEAQLHPQWLLQLCGDMAALDGPIVPVVISQEGYALERLLLEQTVTTNTAAVGGDIRLLALDDT